MISSNQLNVLLAQFSPEYGKLQTNMEKAAVSLKQYNKKSKLDLVVFPETAFTGYIFNSKLEIADLCEV